MSSDDCILTVIHLFVNFVTSDKPIYRYLFFFVHKSCHLWVPYKGAIVSAVQGAIVRSTFDIHDVLHIFPAVQEQALVTFNVW